MINAAGLLHLFTAVLFSFICTLGVFHALAFAADFPPVAPEFINVRTAYASKIWAQLTKNLLAKSSTKRFREYIYL